MELDYSKDVDALYIRFKEATIADTDHISDDIIVDYDGAGNVVGIEVLSVSKRADLRRLIVKSFDSVMVETGEGREGSGSPSSR